MSHALVIGAGPAGLMAADVIAAAGHRVTIADQMPSPGRKFLMAGKSGLNLTKVEPIGAFIDAFGDVPNAFHDALRAFGPDAVQDWATGLGQPTFKGSTGRVFPKIMKASPLLRAWIARLDGLGVALQRRWRWVGWDGETSIFESPNGGENVEADVTVLAMGGASWARLGSDGGWAANLPQTVPFQPANCGFVMPWSEHMTPYFGTPIKATALRAGALISRGEWVITQNGIEGGGVYEVSAAVRETQTLTIDLMPDVDVATVASRVSKTSKKHSRQRLLRQTLRLPPVKAALFNEFAKGLTVTNPESFARAVKALQIKPLTPFPIDGAISTAGGLQFDALTENFMLRERPGVFAAGEMLDWEAPTGGYLITGCLASGRAAGHAAAAWLGRSN